MMTLKEGLQRIDERMNVPVTRWELVTALIPIFAAIYIIARDL